MLPVRPYVLGYVTGSAVRSPSATSGSSATGNPATTPVTKRVAGVFQTMAQSTSSGTKKTTIQRGFADSLAATPGHHGQINSPNVNPA